MKILESNKSIFYAILRAIFKHQGIHPTVAEVGVLEGDNAHLMLETLEPKELYLIDQWHPDAFSDYRMINDHRNWVKKVDEFAHYYGGDLSEQATFDAMHNRVLERFKDAPNVTVMREDSLSGAKLLKDFGVNGLNLVYVDASHQYERVLDDLIAYHSLIDPDFGCIQLNDCFYSPRGDQQNLGVLEAAVRFCKMTEFEPVGIVNRNWTDVLLAPKQSRLNNIIDVALWDMDVAFVEVPKSLFGSLVVKEGKMRPNISFGS